MFHDGVDVTGLRFAREKKVHQRSSDGEGSMEKKTWRSPYPVPSMALAPCDRIE